MKKNTTCNHGKCSRKYSEISNVTRRSLRSYFLTFLFKNIFDVFILMPFKSISLNSFGVTAIIHTTPPPPFLFFQVIGYDIFDVVLSFAIFLNFFYLVDFLARNADTINQIVY